MTLDCSLASYELRDPARLIDAVAGRVRLAEGSVFVVLVEDPSTTQTILSVTALTSPALVDESADVEDEIEAVVRGLSLSGQQRPPRHMAVTVLVRRGLCVFGPNEGRWMSAWRYSHHGRDIWDGELILVTEHGWCDFMTDFAAHAPALAG